MELSREQIDNIILIYLFSEDADIFDEILCDDIAYYMLSDEHCIAIITKRMLETEN